MIKLTILFICVCLSICYYSCFKPKSKTEIEISSILNTIGENQMDLNQVDDLLSRRGASDEVKSAIRTQLVRGFVWHRESDNGGYDLQ